MPCLRLPRLREGRGCSHPPSTNSRESASEAKPWLFSDGNWATWWEYLTDMFHGKVAKSGQIKYANCTWSGKRDEQHMIPFLPGNWDAHILAASNRPRDTKNIFSR